jgi:dipeptidase
MNFVAPSLKLKFKVNNQDYPFSVPVEKKLTAQDVKGFLRYHYQGTEFDLTQGILAGPYGTPFRQEGGPGTGQVPRGIAILRTVYGNIAQTGPEKQLAWFAMDTPLTSVYVPLYARSTGVSSYYSKGYDGEFSRDSAWWAFNFVNNYMQLNYRDSSEQDVYPAIKSWEEAIEKECETIDSKSTSGDL